MKHYISAKLNLKKNSMCKYYKPNPLAATSVATSIGAFPLRKSEKYSLYVNKYMYYILW